MNPQYQTLRNSAPSTNPMSTQAQIYPQQGVPMYNHPQGIYVPPQAPPQKSYQPIHSIPQATNYVPSQPAPQHSYSSPNLFQSSEPHPPPGNPPNYINHQHTPPIKHPVKYVAPNSPQNSPNVPMKFNDRPPPQMNYVPPQNPPFAPPQVPQPSPQPSYNPNYINQPTNNIYPPLNTYQPKDYVAPQPQLSTDFFTQNTGPTNYVAPQHPPPAPYQPTNYVVVPNFGVENSPKPPIDQQPKKVKPLPQVPAYPDVYT